MPQREFCLEHKDINVPDKDDKIRFGVHSWCEIDCEWVYREITITPENDYFDIACNINRTHSEAYGEPDDDLIWPIIGYQLIQPNQLHHLLALWMGDMIFDMAYNHKHCGELPTTGDTTILAFKMYSGRHHSISLAQRLKEDYR